MGLLNFFSCREASRLTAEGLEDSAALARLFTRLHLLYCRHCRRFKRELELLAKAARAWADGLVEEPALKELQARLIARLSGRFG